MPNCEARQFRLTAVLALSKTDMRDSASLVDCDRQIHTFVRDCVRHRDRISLMTNNRRVVSVKVSLSSFLPLHHTSDVEHGVVEPTRNQYHAWQEWYLAAIYSQRTSRELLSAMEHCSSRIPSPRCD